MQREFHFSQSKLRLLLVHSTFEISSAWETRLASKHRIFPWSRESRQGTARFTLKSHKLLIKISREPRFPRMPALLPKLSPARALSRCFHYESMSIVTKSHVVACFRRHSSTTRHFSDAFPYRTPLYSCSILFTSGIARPARLFMLCHNLIASYCHCGEAIAG